MKKTLRALVLLLCLFSVSQVQAEIALEETEITTSFDWSKVMNAIIQVESGGDAKAKSGKSVGAMQITPVLVAECNNILRSRRSKKRFKLSDRFSVKKSKDMFLLFQSKYNPKNSVEWAIQSWNGGLNYSKKRTQHYFEKVVSYLR